MAAFPIRFGHRASGRSIINAINSGLIPWAMRPRFIWRQLVTIADFTGAGATTQTLTFNTLFPRNAFPTTVDMLEGVTVENVVLPVGTSITALTIQVGDTNDPNGLLTASNLLGSGAAVGDILNTPAAAEYASRYEAAYSPTCLLTATGANLSALTAISFEVVIPWTPRAELSS